MKELKKIALILRAMGISANVVNEEITYNGVCTIMIISFASVTKV